VPDNADRRVLAYFGHHKCASTWVVQILKEVVTEAGLFHVTVLDPETPHGTGPLRDSATRVGPGTPFERAQLRERIDLVRADVVSCITADRAQAQILEPARAFHVTRDPRDIIVSAYFSHRNSHPTDGLPHLAAHRAALQEASKEEGLLLEMEFSGHELLELGDWDYTTENILELKMEEMIVRPYETFLSIFRHLELMSEQDPKTGRQQAGVWASRLANRLSRRPSLRWLQRELPVTGEMLLGTVYARRFEANAGGRAKGSEDVGSHYRKGVAGDWISHFTAEHADYFVRTFGDLLIELGYEPDHAWAERVAVQV
jgi:hypothetical protein